MATPKPLDFTAAELRLGGYNLRPAPARGGEQEITFRHWTVVFPTGAKYTFDFYSKSWKRWVTPSRDAYRADHWRNASARHAEQLEAWLRCHPDYVPDTHANRFLRGVPSDAQS